MDKLTLDDVLDSWEAQAPSDGFAARVAALAAAQDHGLRNAGAAEHSLDAWKGERPSQGFAERVLSLAEKRRKARTRARRAMVSAVAMAAIVAGLLVGRLPIPWMHPGQRVSTLIPLPPQRPSAPAASMQGAAVPRETAAATESAPSRQSSPGLSPILKEAAQKTARRPLKRPRPMARPAPVVAHRTPELGPEPIAPEEPAPDSVAHPPGSDTKEAAFDPVAYKRARASAVHREKRFNKTEGSGFGFGDSYRLAP